MGSPAQCRCSEATVIVGGQVHRTHSCPLCVGVALEWFGYQLNLFGERESVSVSAVLPSEVITSAVREVEVVTDDLPF